MALLVSPSPSPSSSCCLWAIAARSQSSSPLDPSSSSTSTSVLLSSTNLNPCLKMKKKNHSPPRRLVASRSILISTSTITSRRRIYYERLNSCVVVPPPLGTPRPRAIIQFLGGAFIGSIPEVTYSYLMEMLAKEGFLVVSVPYNVTFDHSKVAREVFHRFHSCLDLLLANGFSCGDVHFKAADLAGLPIFSVGHSNGALLQLLIGSYFSERLSKANAVVSFNNRPVSEAVPYFDQLGPIYREMMPIVKASPLYPIASSVPGDALKILQDIAVAIGQGYDQETMVSFNNFVHQLPSVLNQVSEGVLEFRPTPSENRDTFGKSYNVSNTLLVKFRSDAIDETDLVEEVLQPRVKSFGGILEKVTLSGNHLTPCIQDLKWQVGKLYTPTDAILQGLKSSSLIETTTLSRTIADWLNGFIMNDY